MRLPSTKTSSNHAHAGLALALPTPKTTNKYTQAHLICRQNDCLKQRPALIMCAASPLSKPSHLPSMPPLPLSLPLYTQNTAILLCHLSFFLLAALIGYIQIGEHINHVEEAEQSPASKHQADVYMCAGGEVTVDISRKKKKEKEKGWSVWRDVS